ncbi:SDR family oxidoreductase [Limnohabitans sp. Rim8]|uniref:SDR family NAD(P)-dependent oxidoreductase n=1 Tax=Limnohabitans sp. Rim8 TaxID=1100718 RepID=UPI00262251DA|nr:SDR family oxidoreductase [Limnohabitans sp. Rim8]
MARTFAQEGASVFLMDADAQGLERKHQKIVQAAPGARVLCAQADVSDPALALQTLAHCVNELGGLDILANNAAMRNYSAAGQATAPEWHAIVGVNLVGITNYCHAAQPHLRSGRRGSIVNVSSSYAVKGCKGMALYDATKAAQLALTRSLACEEAVHGVRVNAVGPGSTLTDFHVGRAQKIGKSVEQLNAERKDTSLLGRWAPPEEIAWPILWMASSEGSFITGSTLVVDGGLHIV